MWAAKEPFRQVCGTRIATSAYSGATEFRGADQPEIAKIAKTQPRIDTEVLKWDPKRQAVGLPEADAIIDPKPSTDKYSPSY